MNHKRAPLYQPFYWVLVFISSALVSYLMASAYFWDRPINKIALSMGLGGLSIYLGRKYYSRKQ